MFRVGRRHRDGLTRTYRLPAPARARIKIAHAVGQGGEEMGGPALELEPGGERSLDACQRDPVVGAEYLVPDADPGASEVDRGIGKKIVRRIIIGVAVPVRLARIAQLVRDFCLAEWLAAVEPGDRKSVV